jgi:hypothetical protein
MKLSWGYRVAILYLGFVALIALLVVSSMRQKVDLVSDDYYEQELKYEDRIEQIKRSGSLEAQVLVSQDQENLIIEFPETTANKELKGSITVFRPSNRDLDKIIEIKYKKHREHLIPLSSLKKGMYRIQIEYKIDDEGYYFEKQVIIP